MNLTFLHQREIYTESAGQWLPGHVLLAELALRHHVHPLTLFLRIAYRDFFSGVLNPLCTSDVTSTVVFLL